MEERLDKHAGKIRILVPGDHQGHIQPGCAGCIFNACGFNSMVWPGTNNSRRPPDPGLPVYANLGRCVRMVVLPLASTLDESLSSPEEDKSLQAEEYNQDMTKLDKVGEYLDQQFERDENWRYTNQMRRTHAR